MNEDNIIILHDDDENEVAFEFLDLITYEGEDYVILLPVDDPKQDQVVILKLEDSEDDPDVESYVSVDDDNVLDAVYALFREQNSDIFDFVDE